MTERATFSIEGKEYTITHVDTSVVKEGVACDVFRFTDRTDVDLGVVTVAPEVSTPLQRVIEGEATLEGFIDGSGTLEVVRKATGEIEEYTFPGEHTEVTVSIGDVMQWTAGPNGLEFYELCWPPYEDGRFEDLSN